MRVFVTGATGLLGPNLVECLLAEGHAVTALVRSLEAARRRLPPSAEFLAGDLRQVPGFAAALRGHDCLIHAGACFREYAAEGCPEVQLDAVNVQGTGELLEAALAAGIRNAVYVSSAGVLRHEPGQPASESSPYAENTRDAYFASKIAAEKLVLRFAAEHPSLRIVSILPTVLAGPKDFGPTPTGRFLRKVVRGEIGLLLPGTITLVDARDVAAAIVAALERGSTGERFLVSGRTYPVAEVISRLARLAGRPMPTHRPPAPVLLVMARLMGIVAKLRGVEPPVRTADLQRLLAGLTWSSGKAERELGITYRALDETLEAVAAWFSAPDAAPEPEPSTLIPEGVA